MCQRLIFLLPVASLCFSLTNAGIVRAKRGANGDQTPQVWDALAALKGNTLTVKHIQDLYPNVVPGTDYPIFFEIPKRNIDCASFKQPGFYADVEVGRCQIFDRCDINGNLYSYLCPNMTLFNQITLVCDWWYNVDCSKERALYDYSNSRLFQKGLHLLHVVRMSRTRLPLFSFSQGQGPSKCPDQEPDDRAIPRSRKSNSMPSHRPRTCRSTSLHSFSFFIWITCYANVLSFWN